MKLTWQEQIIFAVFRAITWLAVMLLVLVFVLLLVHGGKIITWHFLTTSWNHSTITQAGIFPAIVGSLYIGVGVLLVSFPLGFATAIFLTEYAQESWWRRLIQLAIRNLAGVPSVVYGLFGLAVFVHAFSFGTSILSAILTLSIMALPWIVSAATESLESVPSTFRTSSLALGATQWQTTSRIVLPLALPSGITGGIIALARAMGETAPIIMVGATFYLSTFGLSPLDKFMALPYHTFILATQHSNSLASAYAAATALVLIATTFLLNLSAILLRSYIRSQKDW